MFHVYCRHFALLALTAISCSLALISGCQSAPGGRTETVATATPGATRPVTVSQNAAREIVFQGLCDGSAGIALGETVIAVSSDERTQTDGENEIALYDSQKGTFLTKPFPLNRALGLPVGPSIDADDNEADIEAAARIGDTIYWITSHAQSKNKGKDRPARQRFFATTFTGNGKDTKMAMQGKPYLTLRSDLLASEDIGSEMKELLTSASKKRPEEADGWNVEGMSATADDSLLIAFRNPIKNGQAILIPLRNPKDVIEKGSKPKFSKPLFLDVNKGLADKNRGIRDIEYWPENDCYIVLAGSYLPGKDPKAAPFALFQWFKKENETQELKPLSDNLSGLNPEGIVLLPGNKKEYLLLSDDGDSDGCKDKPDPEKSFRVHTLTLP